MAMSTEFEAIEPLRTTVDNFCGPLVIEFGVPWCGFCQAALPLIVEALADVEDVKHIKVQDGKGRPLGRSFKIKLWPTLVFMNDGHEIKRISRPENTSEIIEALALIRS